MSTSPVRDFQVPALVSRPAAGGRVLCLAGSWNLRGLAASPQGGGALLAGCAPATVSVIWDLTEIGALDSAGALTLWTHWGGRMPRGVRMRPEHAEIFSRWQAQADVVCPGRVSPPWLVRGFMRLRALAGHLHDLIGLLGQLVADLAFLARHPAVIPWREISATIHEAGGRALSITALVGFLIGVVVSYLSSLQLQTFGAQVYIVNILGMSIVRELGPMLAAILVAGRSGSSMTAQLGAMRVTQELDALAAIGISHSLRLVLPRVLALAVALPLLVVWTDLVALLGGALSAWVELDLDPQQFLVKLPTAVPVTNLYIGMGKAVVFGLFIALVSCHFGLRIAPNTESMGKETTNSVVVAITAVILVDAVFAIAFRGVGLP